MIDFLSTNFLSWTVRHGLLAKTSDEMDAYLLRQKIIRTIYELDQNVSDELGYLEKNPHVLLAVKEKVARVVSITRKKA